MAVVDGVTLVALVSLTILQDGDTYDGLLDMVHTLHGGCVVHHLLCPSQSLVSVVNLCLSLRCSAVSARL